MKYNAREHVRDSEKCIEKDQAKASIQVHDDSNRLNQTFVYELL